MELTASDFESLRKVLEAEGGMVLEPAKKYLVSSRLEPVAKAHGFADLATLVSRMRFDDRDVITSVVEAMTVNETSWFRDTQIWSDLTEQLLPELLDRRSTLRRLDVWCAASSAGQEPYSLAMVIMELLGSEAPKWAVKIRATDLSAEMVNYTAAGVYTDHETSRGLSPERRRRFMRRQGSNWVMDEKLRSMIDASEANLTHTDIGVSGRFNLIMLRNVLIYFSPDTRMEVLARVATKLAPNGRLVVGAAEGALGAPDSLEPVRCRTLVSYRLVGSPDPKVAAPPPRVQTVAPEPGSGPAVPAPAARSAVQDDGLTSVERLRALRADYNLTDN